MSDVIKTKVFKCKETESDRLEVDLWQDGEVTIQTINSDRYGPPVVLTRDAVQKLRKVLNTVSKMERQEA